MKRSYCLKCNKSFKIKKLRKNNSDIITIRKKHLVKLSCPICNSCLLRIYKN